MKYKTKKLIFNVVVGAMIIFTLVWVCMQFVHLGRVEYTDNAQVKQLIVPVNTRVQGFVSQICFDEYSKVRKGDTLALIEDMEYRYRLAQAMADYQNALSGRNAMNNTIHTTQSNISVSDAAMQEAKIRLDNSQREYVRYKNLFEKDAVTKQQYDAIKTNYDASKARYELLAHQRKSTTLVKQEQTERLNQTEAAIELAKAALDLAKLNLSYTVITAPCNGTTGRKNIQQGQLVQIGQTIVDVVDDDDVWVVANYKETQTANISDGQRVTMKVDAIPDVEFFGVVKSISRATGASYSLIPQDNSSGNFIKVEQRIPVRVEFSMGNNKENVERLRSGMNVECEVKY